MVWRVSFGHAKPGLSQVKSTNVMTTNNSIHLINKYRCALLLMIIGAASGALAQDQELKEDNLLLGDMSSLSLEDLASSRGKQGFDTLQQMNENDQRAWLENNKLESGSTGNNVIETGALQGIEGISTVIQNTGNQVVIQESTLLNLTITP
jgi:hypothetical protein